MVQKNTNTVTKQGRRLVEYVHHVYFAARLSNKGRLPKPTPIHPSDP